MGIRDNETLRLVKYAQSLNISIKFQKHTRGLPGAEWTLNTDGSREIIVYTWPGISKTTIILNMLHELAHEKSYIKQGRTLDPKVLNASSLPDEEMTKKQRKIVYEMEKKDASYRLEIAHELDLKIPKEKIQDDIDLDNEVYKYYYLNNKFPTSKELHQIIKGLNNAKKERKK